MWPRLLVAIVLGLTACNVPDPQRPIQPSELAGLSRVVTREILLRPSTTDKATVRHILIGWRDLDRDDPRAQARSQAEAEALVEQLMAQLKAGVSIVALMKAHSEDPGSVSGRTYEVDEFAGYVIPFQQLAYRLQVGEDGVCQTAFGLHIMRRIK